MFDFNKRRIHHDHQHTPWHELWRQPLAAMIRMPWWLFFTTMAGIYISEIIVFGLILELDTKHIAGTSAMGIPKSFAFAVEAFLNTGLNGLSPDSQFTYSIAVLDLISGLITLSTLTAVVFSKLSSNEMPLIFSERLCISSLDDGHLFCRFVTNDRSQWLNARYTLSLIYDDEPEPGLWQRRIAPLETLNSGTPQLSQTATLTHRLDTNSPISKMGLEELIRRNAVIMPLIEGTDETTGSGLIQTHLYTIKDIIIGYRYSDLVSIDQRGKRRIDTRELNRITRHKAMD